MAASRDQDVDRLPVLCKQTAPVEKGTTCWSLCIIHQYCPLVASTPQQDGSGKQSKTAILVCVLQAASKKPEQVMMPALPPGSLKSGQHLHPCPSIRAEHKKHYTEEIWSAAFGRLQTNIWKHAGKTSKSIQCKSEQCLVSP